MTRPQRASKARAAALGAPAVPRPVPPAAPTLDDLVAKIREPVFALLDSGQPAAAGALVYAYRSAADAAFWRGLLNGPGPVTGQLEAVR